MFSCCVMFLYIRGFRNFNYSHKLTLTNTLFFLTHSLTFSHFLSLSLSLSLSHTHTHSLETSGGGGIE
jgi:hypothetical protein